MADLSKSPMSPDHSYFPKSPRLFRKSMTERGTATAMNSPVSDRAAGKVREDSGQLHSQSQTPMSAVFHPAPSAPSMRETTAASDVGSPDPRGFQSFQSQPLLDAPATNSRLHSPSSSSSQTAIEFQHQKHSLRLARVRKLLRIDKFIGYTLGLFSLCLALVMDGILAYVLHKFYTTKDIPAPGREGPWAIGTELWPAYMLLSASTLTFVIDGATLVAACFTMRSGRNLQKKKHEVGFDSRSKVQGHGDEQQNLTGAARAESTLVKCGYVAFVAKWFIIATLYRTGKTTKDLWGWACDTRAANIQKYYTNDLNFEAICKVQTAAWGMSITEVILKVILMGFVFWLGHKLKKLRKESRIGKDGKEGIGMDDNVEEEPRQGIRRPPSVIWYSVIEASRMLGQSGK